MKVALLAFVAVGNFVYRSGRRLSAAKGDGVWVFLLL